MHFNLNFATAPILLLWRIGIGGGEEDEDEGRAWGHPDRKTKIRFLNLTSKFVKHCTFHKRYLNFLLFYYTFSSDTAAKRSMEQATTMAEETTVLPQKMHVWEINFEFSGV